MYKKFELPDLSNNNIQPLESLQEEMHELPESIPPEFKEENLDENILTQDLIDIEAIKRQAYEAGFKACEQELQPTISKLQQQEKLHELLKLKLLEITCFEIEQDYKNRLSNFILETVDLLIKKLFLSFPVNFEHLFENKILDIINKYHKTGFIEITVHPSQIDYVREITQKDQLKHKDSQNFIITSDEILGNNDCVLKWEHNIFEFNTSAIEKEVYDILEQFKTINV